MSYTRDEVIRTLRIPDKSTLRPDEVAKILGCSDKHVMHGIEEGSFAAVDIKSAGCQKSSLRIVRESLLEYVMKRKTI